MDDLPLHVHQQRLGAIAGAVEVQSVRVVIDVRRDPAILGIVGRRAIDVPEGLEGLEGSFVDGHLGRALGLAFVARLVGVVVDRRAVLVVLGARGERRQGQRCRDNP